MIARLLVAATLLVAACSDDQPAKSGADGGTGLIAVELSASPQPIYPCADPNCTPQLVINYQLTLTNHGPDIQDLRVSIPAPSPLPLSTATLDGGGFNGATGRLERVIDWLPAGSDPIVAMANFTGYITLLPENATDLHGDVMTLMTHARVTQYDLQIAASAPASVTAYLPAKVTPQPMSVYSATAAGDYVYASALPGNGPYSGQGGVYRITIADGTVLQLAKHAMTPADTLPFVLDGATLYYVTHTSDASNTVLLALASDGSGTPATVPLPAGTLTVRALGADATYLFLIVEATDHSNSILRLTKNDLSGAALGSVALGTLEKNTLALTPSEVIVLRSDMPSVWKLDKATLMAGKLADVGAIADERTLACSDQACFFTDGAVAQLFEAPLDGGAMTALTSTNQRILFDGRHLYTGMNGLVRVGPDQDPPLQRLFGGAPAPVQAFDATYLYFSSAGSSYFWKIRK